MVELRLRNSDGSDGGARRSGTDGGARRSALEVSKSSGVSSTLGMSDEISLVRANKISEEI